jgi:acetyl esterase/lipase
MKVTKYLLDTKNAEKFHIDSKRVAISGDSAGILFSFLFKTLIIILIRR